MTVELVRHAARDEDVLFAARVSTQGEQSLAQLDADASKSRGLINYLMRDRHGSPFEHNSMTFYVQAPIFVFREFMRHRIGYCLAGDTEITFHSESGLLRRDTIARLYDRWHNGVQDRIPMKRGSGVSWHEKAGKWMAQTRSNGKPNYLGLFDEYEEAVRVVAEFRTTHPTTRRRHLASVRNQTVRCYNEESLRPHPAKIVDVIQSGVKPLLRMQTVSGRTLRCTKDHAIFTPDGWVKAGDLAVGDAVMVAGHGPVKQPVVVPPSLRRGIGEWTSMQRSRLIQPVDTCRECGQFFDQAALVLDHDIPVVADLTRALDVSNLRPLCIPCHRSKTNLEQAPATRRGSVSAAKEDRVVSIEPAGEEMTYDLSVDGPWHNFVANGVIVHNSYNEESGRYRELQPVFYVPGPERKLTQTGKPGHYEFVDGTPEQAALVQAETRRVCAEAYAAYQRMLDAGIAREVARIVLPLSIYSSMYVTLNARSLMNFLSLRTSRQDSTFPSFPQREIEMCAERMEAMWAELMPLTHAAFDANGRVSP
jgi:thymidylate synthase (FAD)